jgi:hypothetical protein
MGRLYGNIRQWLARFASLDGMTTKRILVFSQPG